MDDQQSHTPQEYEEEEEQQIGEDEREVMEAQEEGEGEEALEEVEEEDEPKYGWAYLPDVCLLQVFRCLRDKDRARATLVCRQWHHIMRSPSLWRARTFSFSGRISTRGCSELDSAVCYASVYGRYLEHLEVRFSHSLNSLVLVQVSHTLRLQLQTMQAFLSALHKTGGCLRSLTILHMELDHWGLCRSVRTCMVRSLTFYLRWEGSHLGHLSLRGACLNLPQGLEVLEAVAAAQQHVHLGRRPGITTLNLEEFFSQPLAVYTSSPGFTQVINKFRGLSTLTLDYSCLSNELLAGLAVSCRSLCGGGSLRSFTLRCHIHEPHFQVIWGDSWSHLARRCPDMQVQISVEQILNLEPLGGILLREIPLRSLSLTSWYFSEQDWSAKPALSSLVPWYSNCLQKLTLDLKNSQESVDEELLALVLMCSKLTYLKVWAFLDISFLDQLLQKRLDKKTILRTIKVRIYNNYDTQDEDQKLEDIYSRYRELITSELNYSAAMSFPTV